MLHRYACVAVVVCCILNIACTRSRVAECEHAPDMIDDARVVDELASISLSGGNIPSVNDSMMCNVTSEPSNTSEDKDRVPRTLPQWKITFNKVNFVIRGIYFPIITILGIVGNALSVYILRKDILKSSSTTYLLGLAVSDLLLGFSYAPTIVKAYPSIVDTSSYKMFSSFYVAYLFPLVKVFHTAAVWIIVAFTVERLIAVAFPLKAHKYCTRSRALFTVGCCFLFAIALNAYRFFGHSVEQVTDPFTKETIYIYKMYSLGLDKMFQNLLFWLDFSASKVVPCCILACLNSVIIWNIWRARSRRLSLTVHSKTVGTPSENQITRMLVSIVTAFFVCTAAYGGANVVVGLYGMEAVSQHPGLRYAYAFSIALLNTNPLVNCILYVTCSQAMRNEIRKGFCPKLYSRSAKTPAVTAVTGVNESRKDFTPPQT